MPFFYEKKSLSNACLYRFHHCYQFCLVSWYKIHDFCTLKLDLNRGTRLYHTPRIITLCHTYYYDFSEHLCIFIWTISDLFLFSCAYLTLKLWPHCLNISVFAMHYFLFIMHLLPFIMINQYYLRYWKLLPRWSAINMTGMYM